jgi:DsbC/DsbD-like thiol-disulfide interchange protein
MQSSPQLADYGYHDDVLLVVPVRVPPSIKGSSGSALSFGLEVKWLICREVCLSDRAQMQISLPAGTNSAENPASLQLFSKAEKLWPKPLPSAWRVRATSGKDDFVLSIQAGKSIAKAEFFPLEAGQIDNAAPQQVQPVATGAKITLKKSDLLLKPIPVLRGVLVIPGGDAYRVEAPIAAGTKR